MPVAHWCSVGWLLVARNDGLLQYLRGQYAVFWSLLLKRMKDSSVFRIVICNRRITVLLEWIMIEEGLK